MTAVQKTQELNNAVYDVQKIRADFPILAQQVNGKKLVFLDTAASAQKPQYVIDAFADTYAQCYANVHRGLYGLSQKTTQAFEDARATIARFINARENEIVFTRNATEAINLVASCWGRTHLQAGDEILISALEHHANIVPWQMIAQQTGANLVIAPITPQGDVRVEDVVACMTPRTKMLAISHMSNALGTVLPVAELVRAAKEKNITTLLDGCQAIMHHTVDVKALGCDFYVFSGHKLYGPTGIGVLYGREELLNAMPPYQGGGDMIDVVTFEKTTYKDAPARFEAGTPAIVEAIALAKAIDYITAIGVERIAAHEQHVYAYACEKLQGVNGLTLYGQAQNRASILSFNVAWAHASDVATILDKEGVCVRVGHHCCMPLMKQLGVTATIRASIGMYTTTDEIDALVTALEKAERFFS